MSFEILFITEGDNCSPAAEIQYCGQRLCLVRLTANGSQLAFGLDTYIGRDSVETMPLEEFIETIRLAQRDLAEWCQNLEQGPHEA